MTDQIDTPEAITWHIAVGANACLLTFLDHGELGKLCQHGCGALPDGGLARIVYSSPLHGLDVELFAWRRGEEIALGTRLDFEAISTELAALCDRLKGQVAA